VFASVVGVASGERTKIVVADLGERGLIEALSSALAGLVRGVVGV
jgi:hypothetical protein